VTTTCPIAYDHDDDPCAVCGWTPGTPEAPEMSADARARLHATIDMLNARIAGGCCPAPTSDPEVTA
jgi:hypothetical protein